MLKNLSDFPLSAPAELALDRRRLLTLAGMATLAALGADWLGRRWTSRRAAPPAALRVPGIAALAPGAALSVTDDAGHEVLVARLRAGTVVAFDRRCPHLGCPVVYAAARDRFECPCHHAAFDARSGDVLVGPPPRGLTAVEVTA